jgi:hypothetical protein
MTEDEEEKVRVIIADLMKNSIEQCKHICLPGDFVLIHLEMVIRTAFILIPDKSSYPAVKKEIFEMITEIAETYRTKND